MQIAIVTCFSIVIGTDVPYDVQEAGPQPLIKLSYKGGGKQPPLPSPFATIDPAGVVLIHSTDRILQAQVAPLFAREAIKSAKAAGFFELHSDALSNDIRKVILAKGQRLPQVLDQDTTCLSLFDGRKWHTIEVYALADYAKLLPERQILQEIVKVVQHIESIVAEVVKKP